MTSAQTGRKENVYYFPKQEEYHTEEGPFENPYNTFDKGTMRLEIKSPVSPKIETDEE